MDIKKATLHSCPPTNTTMEQTYMIPGTFQCSVFECHKLGYLIQRPISEKQRIPGWTDRILFKGAQLNQLQYSRAELYTSDHRPGKWMSHPFFIFTLDSSCFFS